MYIDGILYKIDDQFDYDWGVNLCNFYVSFVYLLK